MKMCQYKWNWWFVLSIIVVLIGLMVGMVAKKGNEMIVADTIIIVGLISLIPCLYIGCKPCDK